MDRKLEEDYKVSLDEKWASPEDFATLFQYFWYRDFPLDQKAIGARRADWTIHIGIAIRNIADLIGLVPRFESGSRKDVILRSTVGDEIAIEWEWKDTWQEELHKLKNHKVRSNIEGIERPLKYAVLITYTPTEGIANVYNKVAETWGKAEWPLLLILIDFERFRQYTSRRKFKNIQLSVFDKSHRRELRTTPALPWEVSGTRWAIEHIGLWK